MIRFYFAQRENLSCTKKIPIVVNQQRARSYVMNYN
jgi:hypothetical protein